MPLYRVVRSTGAFSTSEMIEAETARAAVAENERRVRERLFLSPGKMASGDPDYPPVVSVYEQVPMDRGDWE